MANAAAEAIETVAQFPEKLSFLFEPHRYKVVKGGRYGLKSWNFARALLMICVQPTLLWKDRPLAPGPRVLCARETQKSINESVHQLLEDQINALQLSKFFSITKSDISCSNGGGFSFAGIRQNVNNVKSFEGFDICWVEEAEKVSKNSWNILIPTIRKAQSEIWISFNPDLETDETYQRFVVMPPTNAKVVHTTWQDNPWITEVIRQEIEDLRARSEDDYLNVYGGECKQAVEGAIYKNELAAAEREGRIASVPYNVQHPVHTFWDLGYGDNTSIWFAQSIGFEFRIIDHLSGSLQALSYYIKSLKERPYIYGVQWLPHDGKAHELGTGKSIEEQLKSHFGAANVRCAAKLSIPDKLAAVRAIFGRCHFDREKCADGLQSLRHYRYAYDDQQGSYRREPLHDQYSHDADAFSTLAISIKEFQKKQPQSRPPHTPGYYPGSQGGTSWMQ